MFSFLIATKFRSVALASTALAAVTGVALWQTSAALDCPAGYEARDPADVALKFVGRMTPAYQKFLREKFGAEFCVRKHLPESFMEKHGRELEHAGRLGQSGRALRAALEQKNALIPAKATIEGANGQWVNYGVGPQISLPEYGDGSKDGIPEVSGRADSFAYDESAKRLFVAITYGGIWMSEAVNGDLATLGDHWVSIGDGLPTQINSAVAWTTARGGRVIALSGEHVQGGNTYVGLGAAWTGDLGKTWNESAGLPDGAGGSKLSVDRSNPNIIYAATHKGLYRSDDAGESFVNVNLPVPTCEDQDPDVNKVCQLAFVVSDVVTHAPYDAAITIGLIGAYECDQEGKGCEVLAAVGYRAGQIATYTDGTPQSPGNGLYRSDTGEPGTFTKLGPSPAAAAGGLVPYGFAPQNRIGRIELGEAHGPHQDHNYVYAIVEDALLFNNGLPILDFPTETQTPGVPLDCTMFDSGSDEEFVCETLVAGFGPTSFNGVYVSSDFGTSWIRMADDVEITYNPATGSTLAAVVPLGIGPGVQSWYDQWIKVDPTQQTASLPTRVLFGLEEIWKNNGSSQNIPVIGTEQTNNDFGVIGTYFAGETCLFLIGNLGPPAPVCPLYDGVINGTTTHPDQHDAIYVPDGKGGVWLFVGNDGGVYKQHSSNPLTDDFANNKWGNGANKGFFTLFNYGISAANDGTVYYGLQDNASGKIEPTGRHVRTYIGDGMWTAVDPNNSNIAYVQTPGLSLNRTTNGGLTHTGINPGLAVGAAHFLSPFAMDPNDANHLVAAGTRVAETSDAATGASWTSVFDLGGQSRSRALEVRGSAIYAGWCNPCQVLNGVFPGGTFQFQRGLATNVGPDGWHEATMNGLPNRYIYDIEIDDKDPKTIYVVLGDYSTARWLKVGQNEDANENVGKGHVFVSKDAGANFKDISGNLPVIITTAILKRGNQLIVGTDIGVFISDNLDGRSWAPLGNNLPNVPINQLLLKPDDSSKLFAGTFGRGVQLYTFDNTVKSQTPGRTGKQGKGLLLGAVAPWMLLGLLLGGIFRVTRLRVFRG